MAALLGNDKEGVLIEGDTRKKFVVKTLIPKNMERFPWSGHLGGKLVEQVAQAIEKKTTSLVFTNVRSQTEYWFDALLGVRPEWKGQIGIHHGSIDRKERTVSREPPAKWGRSRQWSVPVVSIWELTFLPSNR